MPGAHFGELTSCEVGKCGCLFRGPDLRAPEFLFPKLLRCMLTTVGSAPFAILQLSAVWLLMRFLTLQRIANPAVVGTIGQTGGVVILAVTSILIWLGCVRVPPLHRIRAILFTAALQQTQSPDQRPPREYRTGPLARRGRRNACSVKGVTPLCHQSLEAARPLPRCESGSSSRSPIGAPSRGRTLMTNTYLNATLKRDHSDQSKQLRCNRCGSACSEDSNPLWWADRCGLIESHDHLECGGR
jgi:hypothetical protein